ncbi:MAG TPA: aminotransferase class V-fold PLP-dependent enzyme [Bacteroidota bacterium]|nr:aminotransferase class V-fold PLP-dependent enzyme [Bacteroidota bacterium]
MTKSLPPETLSSARELFPHLAQGKLYLNHAGTSPLSTRVVQAMTAHLDRRSQGELDTYQQDKTMVEECRASVAQLVNAESPDRIAFQTSTSDAINIVASGIPWERGDRILLGNIEFPANVYPYVNLASLGVALDFIEAPDGRVTAEMIVSHLKRRTRLVALSAVQFLSGYRADLRAIGQICRARGIIFAVDGIQAVGAVRIDVQHQMIDALAAGAQKWQMGPHGSGFLYVSQELQARIRQKYLGWLAVAHPWNFSDFTQELAPSARRYEGGSMNMPSLWGMHAAIRTILEFDPEAIERHILAITGRLWENLHQVRGLKLFTCEPEENRAGIVTVSVESPHSAEGVFKALLVRGVTAALRQGKIRYSPHFYNSLEEMDRVAQLTEECLSHE